MRKTTRIFKKGTPVPEYLIRLSEKHLFDDIDVLFDSDVRVSLSKVKGSNFVLTPVDLDSTEALVYVRSNNGHIDTVELIANHTLMLMGDVAYDYVKNNIYNGVKLC